MKLHQKPRSEASLSDEYETPKEIFDELCEEYNIFPDCDVCATDDNTKCMCYVNEEMDCLNHSFQYEDDGEFYRIFYLKELSPDQWDMSDEVQGS